MEKSSLELFYPGFIGNMEVRNHFVRSATYEGMATADGFPTEAVCDVYRALAEGNVGTVITSRAGTDILLRGQNRRLRRSRARSWS